MTTRVKNLTGQFLIASDEMSDPNFHQTVVLIVQHSEDGAMGVVINRPTPTTVQEAWDKIAGEDCKILGNVHIGGPCEGTLSVMHTAEAHSDLPVLQDLFFSASRDSIEQIISTHADNCRFFIGYAGWGCEQLENELNRGDWHLLPANVDLAFSQAEELWQTLLKKSAGHSVISALNIKHIPDDPSLN